MNNILGIKLCERLEQSVAQVRADLVRGSRACAGRRRIANYLSHFDCYRLTWACLSPICAVVKTDDIIVETRPTKTTQ